MKTEVLRVLQSLLRGELNRSRRRQGQSPWLIGGLTLVIVAISYFLHEPKAPISATAKGVELICTVKSVYDGDTLTTQCPGGEVKVRVFGIDTPELGQKPWGERSRDAMRKLLSDSGSMRLQVKDQDRYGRTVAQVWVGQRDAGLELVRQGRAIVYQQYNDDPAYHRAQAEAQQARRGIWEKPGGQQDPAAWRKLNPR